MVASTNNAQICRIIREKDPSLYVSLLNDDALFSGCDLPRTIDFTSLDTRWCCMTAIVKRRWIKRWFEARSALFPNGAEVYFPLFSPYGCHMEDSGKVYFPLKVFLKRFDAVVKYVFHESAHLWMAQQSYYPDLLELDKRFLQCYGDSSEAICLSPVEHLASRLSLELLSRAAEHVKGTKLAKRLLIQREKEERKLSDALQAFAATRS